MSRANRLCTGLAGLQFLHASTSTLHQPKHCQLRRHDSRGNSNGWNLPGFRAISQQYSPVSLRAPRHLFTQVTAGIVSPRSSHYRATVFHGRTHLLEIHHTHPHQHPQQLEQVDLDRRTSIPRDNATPARNLAVVSTEKLNLHRASISVHAHASYRDRTCV